MSTQSDFDLNTVFMLLCIMCSGFLTLQWWFEGGVPLAAANSHRSNVGSLFVLASYLVFAGMSVCLFMTDLVSQRLPNNLVIPLTGVLVFLFCAATQFGFDRERIVCAFLAAGVMGVVFLLIGILAQGALGGGDIKLSVVLGLLLGTQGWQQWIMAAALMLIVSPAVLTICYFCKRSLFCGGIPFGPWMIGSTWIGIVSGSPLLRT